MARLHAAEHGAERPVPPAVASFRIKPEAAAKLNAFANSPENVQLLARGKDHAVVGGLKQPPDKLWEKYKRDTADWPADLRISRTPFLDFFNQPGCFQILRAKSCLCGPCHENGTLTFDLFSEVLTSLSPLVGEPVAKACKLRATKLHGYLAHEYRGRCFMESLYSTQCITHALCGSGDWGCSCTQHTTDDHW